MSGFDLPLIGTPTMLPSLRSGLGQGLESAASIGGETAAAPPLSIGELDRPAGDTSGSGDGQPRFGSLLADAIDRVDRLQRDVRAGTQSLAAGQPVALHDIMMSIGKSEVAFNLMLEVRNKLVDAWEKLSRAVV